jgi:putative glutamine amidotransferase
VRPEEAAALAAEAAGLLLCGGPDLDPRYYGEEPHATYEAAPARDAVELALLAGARQARTPVFAICRGLQMTNAFLGGSLWQDIPSMVPGAAAHQVKEPLDALAHAIEVTPGSGELGDVLRQEPCRTNSRHHQAIKDLAPGLQAVAVAPDGLVEAIAGRDPRWWVWGVQWHPENLVALAPQRRLFERFREEVEARARELAERRQEPALR